MQRDGQSVDAGRLKIEHLKCQSVTVCIEGGERTLKRSLPIPGESWASTQMQEPYKDDEGSRSMVGQALEDQDGETEGGHRLRNQATGEAAKQTAGKAADGHWLEHGL